ncbi:MAG TPA: SLC13 family permease, partial [Anaerolinea sp.]|nr:SLC13 family permease [Anaerolinea sp.]
MDDLAAPLVSSIIFIASLGLIFTEKVNRVIVAWAGAMLMITAGKVLHFYDETKAVTAIDWNTLGLLLGMMVLVALLEPTGFFQFLAVWAGRLSDGRPFRLLVLLGGVTTVR